MIARKSALIVTSHFFIQFISWIGLVILAKFWGSFAPEALGIIGFAMAFLALFNIVADLGFSRAHVKRVSEGKDLGTCIGTYAAVKLVLTGLMVTVVFAGIFIWKNVLNKGFYDATTESMIFVLVGDLNEGKIYSSIKSSFSGWNGGISYPDYDKAEITTAGKTEIVKMEDKTSATLRLAQITGLKKTDKDYIALSVGDSAFGRGGFSARLMSIIRDDEGLTYGIYSGLSS